MSCANVMLTIAAVATFLFGALGIGGAAAPWIVGIASILIVVVAWTGVTCTWCAKAAQKSEAAAKTAPATSAPAKSAPAKTAAPVKGKAAKN